MNMPVTESMSRAMQGPAWASLLEIKVRAIGLKFFFQLIGELLCLIFVKKPVTTDLLLESQHLFIHVYLPGCAFLSRLA